MDDLEIAERTARARREPRVLRDGRPMVSLECDDVDRLLANLFSSRPPKYRVEVAAAEHLEQVEQQLAELQAAVLALTPHTEARGGLAGSCRQCNAPWPCRTEQVRRLAAGG